MHIDCTIDHHCVFCLLLIHIERRIVCRDAGTIAMWPQGGWAIAIIGPYWPLLIIIGHYWPLLTIICYQVVELYQTSWVSNCMVAIYTKEQTVQRSSRRRRGMGVDEWGAPEWSSRSWMQMWSRIRMSLAKKRRQGKGGEALTSLPLPSFWCLTVREKGRQCKNSKIVCLYSFKRFQIPQTWI